MRSSSASVSVVRAVSGELHRKAVLTFHRSLRCLFPDAQDPDAFGRVEVVAFKAEHPAGVVHFNDVERVADESVSLHLPLLQIVATSAPAFAAMYVTSAPVAASTTPSSKCAQPKPAVMTML